MHLSTHDTFNTIKAQMLQLAIGNESVRKSTRLGTLSSVGAAAAPRFRGKALARIGDTQCAVNEGFNFRVCVCGYLGYFGQAEFAPDDLWMMRFPDLLRLISS